MNQENYIKEISECFNMDEYKLVKIPFDKKSELIETFEWKIKNVQKQIEGVLCKIGVESFM